MKEITLGEKARQKIVGRRLVLFLKYRQLEPMITGKVNILT